MSVPRHAEKLDARLPGVVHSKDGDTHMTPNTSQSLPEPQTIPLELGGQWLAWSADGLRIIAHSATLPECKAAATAAGENDPCFQKAPPANVRVIGVAR